MLPTQRWMAALLIVLLAGAAVAIARPVRIPSYKQLTDKSDLVVIATPIARKELAERTVMPGVLRGNDHIPAIAVETTFRILAVLRGKGPADDQLIFSHLIEANPPAMVVDGQCLVDFAPKSGRQYLMFLKSRDDGRYEAFNGQTDPAFSIRQLISAETSPTTRPADDR